MFIGHYAATFALKGYEPKASLGWLFIATQFVDILFFPFAVLGIESLVFEDNFTAVNNFVMEYPLTHGLAATIVWSIIFYLIWRSIPTNKPQSKQIALAMALAVASHWFTDLIVHTPDLPLIHGEPKFGLGLWHSKWATFLTEAILLLLGLWYYLKRTRASKKAGKYAATIFCGLLLAVNYLNLFVLPAEEDLVSLTVSALIAYLLFAIIAFRVDKLRV